MIKKMKTPKLKFVIYQTTYNYTLTVKNASPGQIPKIT